MSRFTSRDQRHACWSKIKKYAIMAGREVIELALKLYYATLDSDTPAWAKAVITGALAYFILPVDAVPDLLPGGYVDDLGALAAAAATVSAHIKEEHAAKARETLKRWFGDDGSLGSE
ncbi:YkvA family protein [Solemya elarraichensis gill symbiont]|uniref:DUF1232 domain-containing protein n=1 Tax=Solemya elarraichensis gill symbiont TaxID=1918949 RepID=A0A1T2L864_9GAMM|nr:DUF1232 domain-containing protein [Solemya elarraichensis gill symbiont]OOZ41224.1 hypothetical protein BOW52_04910 [Solemya elarraichensis gill symbiont]